ncbi:MAG: hypothetical protein Q9204_003979 [Flavoplaca sp. TL-2023a]
MPPRKKQRRHRHTPGDWEDIKGAFVLLYIQQDKSLESVMEILESESGFKASLRQYKNKIKEWALIKNIKASDARALVAKEQQRGRERGVGTLFSIGDAPMDHDRWERLVSRINSGKSDLPSPTSSTPLGITYHTPETVLDAGSPVLEGYELFASKIRHHYDTIADIVTIDVLYEKNTSTDKTASQVNQHLHQGAAHGVACRGLVATMDQTTKIILQANNLASGLDSVLRSPSTVRLVARNPWTTDPAAPECWVSSKAVTMSASTTLHLISHVKHRTLCQHMLGLGRHDTTKWLNGWRLMEESTGFEAQAVANNLFGDPSLPYPEMGLISLLIRFTITVPEPRLLLMRVCMVLDRDPKVGECNYCHSACMLLDVIDSQTAVKAHVPLSACTAKRSYSSWTDFLDVFIGKIHVRKATWKDIAYRHQGLHEVYAPGPLTEETFRPFHIKGDGWVCRSCRGLKLPNTESGLGCDSVPEKELVFGNGNINWDKQEDEEAYQFDPYPSDEGLTMSDDTDEGSHAQ